jgi:hypothetical protein
MRNRLLLLLTAVILSACADDQHATGPASRSGVGSRSASGDASPSTQGIAPQAKPTDQVGFTKIVAIYGESVDLAANTSANATVTCPAGSVATGGGFATGLLTVGSIPTVRSSNPITNPSGWLISVSNIQPGAVAAVIQAWVLCAS